MQDSYIYQGQASLPLSQAPDLTKPIVVSGFSDFGTSSTLASGTYSVIQQNIYFSPLPVQFLGSYLYINYTTLSSGTGSLPPPPVGSSTFPPIISATVVPASQIVGQYSAAQSISIFSAVSLSGAGLVYADHSDLALVNSFVGVVTQSGLTGTVLNVTEYGLVTDTAWNWAPDLPIVLGSSGSLTQMSPPPGSYLLTIGTPMSATSLFVNPQSYISL